MSLTTGAAAGLGSGTSVLSEAKSEVERLRAELAASRRDLQRALEVSELDKARWVAEASGLRTSAAALQASADAAVAQRARDVRQRGDATRQVDELRAENSRLRRDLAAAIDTKLSHLRVPLVSFEQYRELLSVTEALLTALGSGGGAANAATAAATAQAAREWVDKMQAAPFASAGGGAAVAPPLPLPRTGLTLSPAVSPKGGALPATAMAAAEAAAVAVAVVGQRESLVEGGGLVKLVSEQPDGGRRWELRNATADTQYVVEFAFGPLSRVEPLGDTTTVASSDGGGGGGRTLRANLYPGETKPFAAGAMNGYRMSIRFGPPDDGFVPSLAATDAELLPLVQRVREAWRPSDDAATVAARCAADGTPFVDVDFPPLSASVARPHERASGAPPPAPALAWLPPARFLPRGAAPQLCTTGMQPTALVESAEARNEWLVSAFAALAEDPDAVGRIFAPTSASDEQHGIYFLWLNRLGLWNLVHTDAFLPCREIAFAPSNGSNGGNGSGSNRGSTQRRWVLHGARCRDPADLWPALLEKAFAKCCGSYDALAHSPGDVLEALQDMTGFPTERFDWARDRDTGVFASVHRHLAANAGTIALLTTADGTGGSSGSGDPDQLRAVRALGLKPRCAYRVLAAVSADQFRLVLIRNPFAGSTAPSGGERSMSPLAATVAAPTEAGRWAGMWSEQSDAWHRYPHVRKACQTAAAGIDGVGTSCFWMEWRDAAFHFAGCGVCHVRAGWLDVRVPLRFASGKPSSVVEVRVRATTRVLIGIHQRDRRGLAATDPEHTYSAFMATLIGVRPAQTPPASFEPGRAPPAAWEALAQSHGGTFWRGRDAFLEVLLESSAHPYFVVPRRYAADGVKDAVLSLHVERRDALKLALREPSDEMIGALRFSPLLKFDPAACATPATVECQIDKQPSSALVW